MKATKDHIERVANTVVGALQIDHATLYQHRFECGLTYITANVPPDDRAVYKRSKVYWNWWTQVCTNVDEEWCYMHFDETEQCEARQAGYLLFLMERVPLFRLPKAVCHIIQFNSLTTLTTT